MRLQPFGISWGFLPYVGVQGEVLGEPSAGCALPDTTVTWRQDWRRATSSTGLGSILETRAFAGEVRSFILGPFRGYR